MLSRKRAVFVSLQFYSSSSVFRELSSFSRSSILNRVSFSTSTSYPVSAYLTLLTNIDSPPTPTFYSDFLHDPISRPTPSKPQLKNLLKAEQKPRFLAASVSIDYQSDKSSLSL